MTTPKPPLSPFRRVGNVLFTAGLTGRRGGILVGAGLEAQTQQILTLLDEILTSNGLSAADVRVTNLYLTAIDDLPVVNQLYTDYFHPPYPARTTIQCGLGPGVLVELNALAEFPTR